MRVIFVQLQCKPGTSYQVADVLYEREQIMELFSTSGEWDLLAKFRISADEDIGKWVNDNVLDIEGIEKSLTTITFTAF